MAEQRGLSSWQIVTLVAISLAVVASAAVALILGKDAIIAIAVILVIGVIAFGWLNS